MEYSIVIRTTGKAGEKYQNLLESIKRLMPQPKEIIVVLPEGYSFPDEVLGEEKFYFCPKGMVIQRLVGLEKCKTPYALVLDDDIAFESDFVLKLSSPVVSGEYGFSAGPLLNFFPEKGLSTFVSTLLGGAMPSVLHKNRYNTVLRTTGYSFNRSIDIEHGRLYETQSAAWTCFFADVEKFRSIHFEDELWLDKNGYSAHDDTAMFYKAWLRGIKSVIVSDALYDHLDAKTSTKGNKEKVLYAISFNTVVFWHRFLSGNSWVSRFWSGVCINYKICTRRIMNLFSLLMKKRTKQEYIACKSGIKDGWKWINSKEYKKIPSIYRE